MCCPLNKVRIALTITQTLWRTVRQVIFVWLVGMLQQDELKCVMMAHGALCVMTSGTMKMPELSAINWDSLQMVTVYPIMIGFLTHSL